MLKKIRERLAEAAERSEGFTLIELMVVVLIIAILIAIAIPTFLGARERAQNRAAQSNLRNALTAEETFYTDNEFYADNADDLDGTGTADLSEIEGSLNWQAAGLPAVAGDVGVTVTAVGGVDSVVCLDARSSSGKSYAIKKVATGANAGVYYESQAVAAASCGDGAAVAGWDTEFS